jgi:flagellar hook-associated protein 3 FlgL
LVTIRSELNRVDQFTRNIVNVNTRLELMEFTMNQVETVARDFRGQLNASLNGNAADLLSLPETAAGLRDQVVDLLNTRDDTRYLFAGGKVDTRPVDLNNGTYTAPSPPPFPAATNTDYYEGDNVAQQVRVDEGFVVDYGITADSAAFEKIIRSLDSIANTTFTQPITATEQQVIKDAVTALSSALDNGGADKTVAELFADTALDRKLLDDVQDKHDNFIAFATNTIGEIENINTADAVATLNFEQVQLEATFTTLVRVQQLTLTNFLR